MDLGVKTCQKNIAKRLGMYFGLIFAKIFLRGSTEISDTIQRKRAKSNEKNFFHQNLNFQRLSPFYVLFTLFLYLGYFWKNIQNFGIRSIFGQKFLPSPKINSKIQVFYVSICTFYPLKGCRNFCRIQKKFLVFKDEVLI